MAWSHGGASFDFTGFDCGLARHAVVIIFGQTRRWPLLNHPIRFVCIGIADCFGWASHSAAQLDVYMSLPTRQPSFQGHVGVKGASPLINQLLHAKKRILFDHSSHQMSLKKLVCFSGLVEHGLWGSSMLSEKSGALMPSK